MSDDFKYNLKNNILKGAPSSNFLWPKEFIEFDDGDCGYLMDVRSKEYHSFVSYLTGKTRFKNKKMLLTRMDSCADKIINLVNSMRNQIRNIGSDEKAEFNISSVINDTLMIVHNETMKKGVKINLNIKDEINVIGNATKLGQVITNLVMNAIQAYEDKPGMIDIDLYKSDKNEAVITVEDYAGGIPESIRPHIFKNILTTKGVSGTGFGLYLAYSVIKGAFGGDMYFDTKTGKGTKFVISIPLD